jgi:hypothetical protein
MQLTSGINELYRVSQKDGVRFGAEMGKGKYYNMKERAKREACGV